VTGRRPGLAAGDACFIVRGRARISLDGHRFIPQAVGQGAAAVVAEVSASVGAFPDTLVIRVPDSRKALARLAAEVLRLSVGTGFKLVGITGTKGNHDSLSGEIHHRRRQDTGRGLIGTIDYRIGDPSIRPPNNHAGIAGPQALLAEMAEQGARSASWKYRPMPWRWQDDECVFEAAAFTNLCARAPGLSHTWMILSCGEKRCCSRTVTG